MPVHIDLGTAYADSRRRLSEVVLERADEAKHIQVACCPGWSVHDVLSHLVAVAEDAVAGRLTGPPSEEQSAEQVRRRAGVTTQEVLDEWERRAPALQELLSKAPVWPALMDVLAHEHDVRAAVGEPGARDIPEIGVCARRLTKGLDVGQSVTVTLDGESILTGGAGGAGGVEGEGGAPELELRTSAWEAFRFRLGRRSRAQLAGMEWTGDPRPILDRLTIFGPSPVDIVE